MEIEIEIGSGSINQLNNKVLEFGNIVQEQSIRITNQLKGFDRYVELVRQEKIRIKEMEIEHKLLKELNQNKPSFDEMTKQVQVIYNFFDKPTPTPKKQRVKKLTKEQEFQKLIEEQEKKIELMEMTKMVNQGKLSI